MNTNIIAKIVESTTLDEVVIPDTKEVDEETRDVLEKLGFQKNEGTQTYILPKEDIDELLSVATIRFLPSLKHLKEGYVTETPIMKQFGIMHMRKDIQLGSGKCRMIMMTTPIA